MIQVGDRLPEGQLVEFVESEGGKYGPKLLNVSESVKGKRIAILAVPAIFHADYLKQVETCKEKGVDEVWCAGANDPFIMSKWGRELKNAGKVRLVADGSGVYTKALGLEAGYGRTGAGVGSRSSLLVEDGILKQVNPHASGKFEASNDEKILAQVA